MRKLKKKTRGAISVFLVIILVPCIVITSLFIDLGRVYMSHSVADSSADLALNSLLTNYDADLNEWYGMVASCQNIDEFYEISAQYFLRTISSQGLSDSEIYLLSDYYSQVTGDDTINDLLQMECNTDPSAIVGEKSGANLTNAAMIKREVVEFMKYRAPIEITMDVVDRLKENAGSAGLSDAKEADTNKPLVEDKQEFYEAEGDLLSAAYNSYCAIYEYYLKAKEYGLTGETIKEYINKIDSYEQAYKDIHTLMVKNLFNTTGLNRYYRVTYDLNAYYKRPDEANSTYKSTSVYTKTEEDTYYIDEERINKLLDKLEEEIEDFNESKSQYNTAIGNLINTMPGSGTNDAYAIQWWKRMDSAVNGNKHTDLSNKAKEMLIAYGHVKAIKDCEREEGEEANDDWENRYNNLTSQVESLQQKYLTAGRSDSSDPYLKAVSKLEEVSRDNVGNITSRTVKVTVDGQQMSVEDAVPYIQTQMKTMGTQLNDCIKLLDVAIDGNGFQFRKQDRVVSLDKLLELVRTYDRKLSEWDNTADSTDTTMGEENREEIKKLNSDEFSAITEESVNELKTRLENIRSQMKTINNVITKTKYGNKQLKAITTFSGMKSQAGSQVSSSSIPLLNGELSTYSENAFSKLYQSGGDLSDASSKANQNKYNPQIDPATGEVETPELFRYFDKKFDYSSKNDVKKKQKELDDGEDAGDDEATNAKDKGRYHGGGSNITKDFSSGGSFSLLGDAGSGIITFFTQLIDDPQSALVSQRDSIYATSYVMNMCSWATYENEGLYHLVEKKTDLTLGNYSGNQYYGKVKGNENTDGSWLSANLKDNYNKSLTNKLINKDNNAAYCAEAEYILYGEDTNDKNVKDAYGAIYGIKYPLNLVAGFQHFWSGNNNTAVTISAIAGAIATATAGIIPVPVTKVVLIPILAVFETSKDMDRLEAGFPVEIYKSNVDMWWVKLPDDPDDLGSFGNSIGEFVSSLKNALTGKSHKNTGNGLFYSDYITAFLFLGFNGKSSDAMYQRLGEVIQTNMRKITSTSDFSMSKARLYFTLNAEMHVKPLMVTLPFFGLYDNDLETNTSWNTYQISITRGYS